MASVRRPLTGADGLDIPELLAFRHPFLSGDVMLLVDLSGGGTVGGVGLFPGPIGNKVSFLNPSS
jgi:hypothetical protein